MIECPYCRMMHEAVPETFECDCRALCLWTAGPDLDKPNCWEWFAPDPNRNVSTLLHVRRVQAEIEKLWDYTVKRLPAVPLRFG